MASFLTLMRTIFMEKEQWTLNELFEILSKNSNLELSENVMKHRIRSGVYSLKRMEKYTCRRFYVQKGIISRYKILLFSRPN